MKKEGPRTKEGEVKVCRGGAEEKKHKRDEGGKKARLEGGEDEDEDEDEDEEDKGRTDAR